MTKKQIAKLHGVYLSAERDYEAKADAANEKGGALDAADQRAQARVFLGERRARALLAR